MATTLHDVAHAAGVSIRTVTNVLNGQVRVSDKTRTRVMKAIERLDYRPNLAARNLREGKTGILALVVPNLAAPYFATLASVVIQEGNARGYQVIVEQGDLGKEVGETSEGRMQLADIVLYASSATKAQIRALGNSALASHVVFLGEYDIDGGYPQVSIDNFAAVYDVTSELLKQGCKKVVAIGAEAEPIHVTTRRRTEGFVEALRRAGHAVDENTMVPVNEHTRTEGYSIAENIFKKDPDIDGVVCYSDTLAIGVLAALRNMGIAVPENVKVVGIDNSEEGRFMAPSLTTISFDLQEMVRSAFPLLSGECETNTLVIPHEIIRRESTA